MGWRPRFEGLIRERSSCPQVAMRVAEIGPPAPHTVLEAAQEAAGASWPAGMTEPWVEENIDRIAELFPDFAPSSISPSERFEEIDP